MKDIKLVDTLLSDVSDTFCLAKWHRTNLRLYNGNSYSCHHCFPHKADPAELKEDPSNLTNTKEILEYRQQMLNGERPVECSYCWKKEDVGLTSDRKMKSKQFLEMGISIDKTASSLKSFPTILDIAFDNTCNFKCSYCGPENSSMWVEETEQFGPYPTVYTKKPLDRIKAEIIPNRETNPYIDAFWKWWDDGLAQHLQRLTITGGEPLLSKHTWKVLDKVISQNLKLVLNINTNLCVPEKLFDDFKNKIQTLPVRTIEISTSIESLGKQAEYSRYGMDFEKWKKNVHSILEDPKVKLHINLTNNALSYNYMHEALQFMIDLKIQYGAKRIYVSSNDVNYPTYLDIRVLPHDIIDNANKNIQNVLEKNQKLFSQVELEKIQRTMSFAISKMEKHEQNISDFKNFIIEYDRRRNTNYKEVFPEFIGFINE